MSVESKRFKALLKSHGHFMTKPRLRLFTILQEHSILTIPELIALLERHDQATVYRNIKLFEELGVINRLRLGWNSKLELSDMFQHHHHHLTCISCGKVIALPEDELIEERIGTISRTNHFKAVDHQLEIRGLCTTCQKLEIRN
jgi:Fur family ferric uptake transcriptional regulator